MNTSEGNIEEGKGSNPPGMALRQTIPQAVDDSSSKATSLLSQISKILAELPGSWIFLGLFLFLAASGSISFTESGHTIKMDPPRSEMLCACIAALGMGVIVLGIYVVAKDRIPTGRVKDALFAGFWGMCVVAIFLNAWGDGHEHFNNSWGYDYSTGQFTVCLDPEGIKPYSGKSFVLVVRKKNGAISFDRDEAIAVSRPAPICHEYGKFETCVDLTKWPLKLMDDLEAHVVVVPNNVNVQTARTLGEIYGLGGQKYMECGCFVRIDKVSRATIKKALQDSTGEERIHLIQDIIRDLEPDDQSALLRNLSASAKLDKSALVATH